MQCLSWKQHTVLQVWYLFIYINLYKCWDSACAIPCLSRQQLITTSNLIKIIHYLQVALLPPSSFAVNVSVAVGWYTSFFMTPIQEGINLLLWLFYADCFLNLLMKTKMQGLVICSIYWLWVDFLPKKVIFHTKCIYLFTDYITFYKTNKCKKKNFAFMFEF